MCNFSDREDGEDSGNQLHMLPRVTSAPMRGISEFPIYTL